MNMIKQMQIDELVKAQKAAIIFFQESHILDQTFENCPHIKANFQLLPPPKSPLSSNAWAE